MSVPLALSLMVWVIYNYLGVKNQGFFGYMKNSLFPPGVPKALYLIVTPIEFFSVFIIRPLSLAIRLWANMVAGHLLLVTFAVLSATLWDSTYVGAIAPAAMLVIMTAFEIVVSFVFCSMFFVFVLMLQKLSQVLEEVSPILIVVVEWVEERHLKKLHQ